MSCRFVISARRMFLAIAIAILLVGRVSLARAQIPEDPMGLPIPTTIVLAKPAPGEPDRGRLHITVSVGGVIYRFILKDGYTNHLYVKWPSIWEQVRQSSPNLIAEGQNASEFSQVEPGTTVTVSGMYTATQRVFEVITIEGGEGRFERGGQHR